ncbi:hypothetical protein Desaci_4253 [Desulfosporosinus acidiphilus SJ4]|uniref:Uncharacterized protein n=1 Tax=Desulfosporosinus acidiphilus (strain DSM 22704 / JCM 16185 / SJ4) TaxID=646529 RepID=I4DBD6_DESAJ|nr:hypothetical protein [Desulfosporosinus acidiphilus]AFM43110.1 hypothetical protein Desaci_4253 [Desulfosporosinus acidiphilus SJ4]
MKFILFYFFALTILLLFNYGAHAKKKIACELYEGKDHEFPNAFIPMPLGK